jgi:lipoprotein-anchoring transpeptidase ErfK/SrfK
LSRDSSWVHDRPSRGVEDGTRGGRGRAVAAVLAVIAAASLAVTGYACALAVLNRAHLGRGAHAGSPGGTYVVNGIASYVSSSAFVQALASAKAVPRADPAATPAVSLTLTGRDHAKCPAAAAACVDLAEHITWLQSGGKVTYGPVQMEPGPPGTPHATPTGRFSVQWKAGPHYKSTLYNEVIPWAVFFAPGGIAFHAGSLTVGSHGCVHLTLEAAHYYNQHLPVGAEVVVF